LAVAVLAIFAAHAGGPDLDELAGVYIKHFLNGDVSGTKFWSDDVFEIVKVSPSATYFPTYLNFYNGHECALSGIAEVVGHATRSGRP
jgi:hypothetical protein